MATTKPRITLTLPQRHYDLYRAISDMTHQPMSAFIVELLESAFPTIERMAVTFQKVKSAQVAERSRFLESLDRAQAAVEPVVMDAVDQFDLFLTRVEGIVDGGGDGEGRTLRDAPASAAATPSAPPLTGGHRHKKKAAKPAMARLTADSASKRNLKKRGLSKVAI